MDKKTKIPDLPDFDLVEHLKSEEDIAHYLTMVMAEGDASELAHALGIAAKAQRMSVVVKSEGIIREA